MEEIDEFFKEMSKKEPPLKGTFGHNSWIGNLPRAQYQLDKNISSCMGKDMKHIRK